MPTLIVREKCNNCGICIFQCGADVYEGRWTDGNFLVTTARSKNCVDCLLCVDRCPRKAIEIYISGIRHSMS